MVLAIAYLVKCAMFYGGITLYYLSQYLTQYSEKCNVFGAVSLCNGRSVKDILSRMKITAVNDT